ncbi:hypothetical protein BCON_0133g00300 [Botryotinia convoluta]|uniref:Uncharacterized protein n=1 Tax=Botryotinia convoluta TaxID=54673 RepID=A0A4Z1HV62_9HELO|nr:hypothetical protein BCON_0133g00300 [Botryotinia convoluta]
MYLLDLNNALHTGFCTDAEIGVSTKSSTDVPRMPPLLGPAVTSDPLTPKKSKSTIVLIAKEKIMKERARDAPIGEMSRTSTAAVWEPVLSSRATPKVISGLKEKMTNMRSRLRFKDKRYL